jgi:hypothetical protein
LAIERGSKRGPVSKALDVSESGSDWYFFESGDSPEPESEAVKSLFFEAERYGSGRKGFWTDCFGEGDVRDAGDL